MEARVSIWENAFVLQAMKETNVKLVSSISVCLLSFTSAFSSVSAWTVTCDLPLLGSQRGSHTAVWDPQSQTPHASRQVSYLEVWFIAGPSHPLPCSVFMGTRLGNNPQAVCMQVIPCGRQMCCHAKPVGGIYFQTLWQITLGHSRLGLSQHFWKGY